MINTGRQTKGALQALNVKGLDATGRPFGMISVTEFGAKGDGVTDDTQAFLNAIAALPGGVFAGGTIYVPPGNYVIKSTLNLPSGCRLTGVSPQASRLVAGVANMSIITLSGVKRIAISNLMLDGTALANSVGITMNGESNTISVRDVWFDSFTQAVFTNYAYFVVFDTVRMQGCTTGFDLGAISNSIVLTNTSMTFGAGSQGLRWRNSAGLTISGCMFEGIAPVSIWNCQGAVIQGCYFENMGVAFDSWLSLGLGTGVAATGVSIKGNHFANGANYGIMINAAQGVDIEGNNFRTELAAIQWYLYDNSPKRSVNIGNNAYNIANLGYDPTKVIAQVGPLANNLNANSNREVVQPQLFYSNVAPQDVTIGNNQAVLYWDGAALKLKSKDATGVVKNATVATPV